jgi:hypothetical protein
VNPSDARPLDLERLAGLVPLAVALVAAALAWRSDAGWFGPAERAWSAFAVLGTAAAAGAMVRASVSARVWVAAALLLAAPALRVGELLGYEFPYIAWEHGPVATITSVAVLIAIVGLVRRRVWGRWLALGGALAGLGGELVNGLATLAEPGMLTWAHACATAGCGALVLLVRGPAMREAFEGATASDSLWRSREPVVRALRWALILTFVSVPMLLVYAIDQTVVPGTREAALALAGAQIGAALLCLRRKLVGALLLSLAGAGLLVFTLIGVFATGLHGVDAQIMLYYAAFWLPAAVGSVVAGAVMLAPLRALLRRGASLE